MGSEHVGCIPWYLLVHNFPPEKGHVMGLPHSQSTPFKLKTCCEEYSVSVDPERVVVCNGGMEAAPWLSKNIQRCQEDAA